MIHFKPLPIVFLFLSSIAWADQRCSDLLTKASTTPAFNASSGTPTQITKELIDHNLFLVHATDFFPQNGVIRAGGANTPTFRPTIHFTLGGLVQSHALGAWENKKFAIIVPYGKVINQIVNVLPQDTVVLGDLALPKGSLIIAQQGAQIQPTAGIKVIFFDPLTSSLRSTVDQVISENGGWNVKATGGNLKDVSEYNGVNLNSLQFFEPLLTENSSLFFNLHSETPIGKIDLRAISFLGGYFKGKVDLDYSSFELKSELIRFEMRLSKVDQFVNEMGLSGTALEGYLRNRSEFMSWVDVLRAELETRTQYGKSFLADAKTHSLKLKQLRHDSTELRRYMAETAAKSADIPFSRETSKDRYLRNEFSDFSFEEFKEVLKKNKDLADEAGGEAFLLATRAVTELRRQDLNPNEEKQMLTLFHEALLRSNDREAKTLTHVFIWVFQDPLIRRSKMNVPGALERLGLLYDTNRLLDSAYDSELEFNARKKR